MPTFITSPFGHYAMDEPARGPSSARPTEDVHVRVPADLKHDIEAAAERAGVPADLWLLETLGRSVASARA
jgi:hypothetical protein